MLLPEEVYPQGLSSAKLPLFHIHLYVSPVSGASVCPVFGQNLSVCLLNVAGVGNANRPVLPYCMFLPDDSPLLTHTKHFISGHQKCGFSPSNFLQYHLGVLQF